eukprot:gb/GECG01016811.1/.p1 GENE.gb/GECG01016811.1/~~gb/GECG01016811.1/.p1  ORF type:complete len:308 (+),score=23.77 gb/GECG01016811.1/:1-924(+)
MLDDVVINAIAGGLSGVTVDFILFPLDTVKTRLQSRKLPGLTEKANVEHPPRLSNTAKMAGQALRAKGFYQGLFSAMLGSFPAAATFWTTYEGTKRILEAQISPEATILLPLVHMTAASVAEIAVCAVRNPFEVVKQQMQAGHHQSTAAAVRDIIKTDGFRGLFAGYWSTVLREIPFDAVEFALYEFLKRRLIQYRRKDDLVLWENCILGSTAGAIAAGLTTPLDVIKTRLMTQTKYAQEHRYSGIRHALRRIVTEEGVRTLFSGAEQRILWIGLGGTIFFGTYEEAKRRLYPRLRGTKITQDGYEY